jgi:glycosyltransferase involved in cell wall biosynthesis
VSTSDSSTVQVGSENVRQWHVAQLGAREHYAVPRALARRGRLDRFYTDAWCRWGRSWLRRGPALLRAFANRYHPELAAAPVTAFNARAVWNVARRRFRADRRAPSALAAHHVEVGRWFAGRVRDEVRERGLDPETHAFFGFSTGSLEALELLADRGVPTVLDQVSPGRVEHEIVRAEAERWPGWARTVPGEAPTLQRRVAAEWEAASLVLVNSEWSRSALVEQGVPEEKIIVVPGAYELPAEVAPSPPDPSGPLRVLWLGSVVLRKGIPYLVEAARMLSAADIEVTVAGPIGITDEAVARAPDNVTFVGTVPRDRVSALYRAADVFVLPTLSDGFGITQVEAMAHGCPVIATLNCGRVVTDGEDGRIVPPRDAGALAEALAALADNRDRLAQMSRAAQATAADYTIDAYARRLLSAVDDATTSSEGNSDHGNSE